MIDEEARDELLNLGVRSAPALVVNGKVAVADGVPTDVRAGRFIGHGAATLVPEFGPVAEH